MAGSNVLGSGPPPREGEAGEARPEATASPPLRVDRITDMADDDDEQGRGGYSTGCSGDSPRSKGLTSTSTASSSAYGGSGGSTHAAGQRGYALGTRQEEAARSRSVGVAAERC